MSLKSKFLCSQCSKTLKDPIVLPCKHHICLIHLKESNVLKENKIKCLKCNESNSIEVDTFQTNELLNLLLDEFKFLSCNEIMLKQQLEDGIKRFFHIQDELLQSNVEFELEIFEKF